MTINTAFDVGAKIFFIHVASPGMKTCHWCDGNGTIALVGKEGMTFTCPSCRGKREIPLTDVWTISKQCTIERINIFTRPDKNAPLLQTSDPTPSFAMINYELRDTSLTKYERHESLVFKTSIEAAAECKKRNDQEIAKRAINVNLYNGMVAQ
jgi:hypothetical protein